MIVWKPDMNENIYRDIYHELWRFPYLSDPDRNEKDVMLTIGELFNSPSSLPFEYDGGYYILHHIHDRTAELGWIHFPKRVRFSHRLIRICRNVTDVLMRTMDRITMKTPDQKVCRLVEHFGLKMEGVESEGFEWHGKKMPMYHMARTNKLEIEEEKEN